MRFIENTRLLAATVCQSPQTKEVRFRNSLVTKRVRRFLEEPPQAPGMVYALLQYSNCRGLVQHSHQDFSPSPDALAKELPGTFGPCRDTVPSHYDKPAPPSHLTYDYNADTR